MSKRWRFLLIVLVSAVLLSANGTRAQPLLPPEPSPPSAERAAAADSSVLFIENVGQFAEGPRFQVWGGDHTTWLAEDGI